MTAATATKRKAASATKEAPQSFNWRPLFHVMQAKVPPLLWAIHERLDDSFSESAFRLSAIAAQMIEAYALDAKGQGIDHDAGNLVYDCLALIASAMATKGQDVDELSLGLLGQVDEMLHTMMWAMNDTPSVEEIAAAQATFAKPEAEDQPRPHPPAAATHADADDESPKAWRDLAFQSNFQVQKLAEGMKKLVELEGGEEWALYSGMLSRILLLTDITHVAARLDNTEENASYMPFEQLQRVLEGALL